MRMQILTIVTAAYGALSVRFPTARGLQLNIGVIHSQQSMAWQNVRHAVDEWNRGSVDGSVATLTIQLIAPNDALTGVDARVCDVTQREIVALVVSLAEITRDDALLALSMCRRLRMPCVVDAHVPLFTDSEYVINVGLGVDVIGRALAQLIVRLMWNQFLLVYRTPDDLAEMAPLLSVWHTINGARTSIRVLRLPTDVAHFDVFLKHIRERLRVTNIVVHTGELSIIHTFLVRANRLNMTQSRYSYVFSNLDLRLLEEFFTGFENTFHCNVTGVELRPRLVERPTADPPAMKSDLRLALVAVELIGGTLQALAARRQAPRPQALLCDAGDMWRDGEFLAARLRDQLTSDQKIATVPPSSPVKRRHRSLFPPDDEDGGSDGGHYLYHLQNAGAPAAAAPPSTATGLVAITRTVKEQFIQIGAWDLAAGAWDFEDAYENKWKFRGGNVPADGRADAGRSGDAPPDLSGERLRVVVYLEEPFIMRKLDYYDNDPDEDLDDAEEHRSTFDFYSNGSGGGFGAQFDNDPAETMASIDDAERARRKTKRCARTLAYEGFCIDLLCEMAVILNFTFEIVEVEDGTYGVEDEFGMWNGIIGVLQRHEADLSVSAVTITYSRISVIDFTLPFMHFGIAILIARGDADGSHAGLFTFLEPLSASVWLALIIAYFGVSGALCFLARVSPYEWFNDAQRSKSSDPPAKRQRAHRPKNQFDLLNSLWFAVGSLMHQGSDVIPRAAATRALALVWWMFTLILISTYTAQLAAFLTAERMNVSIESAADLTAQQRVRFGTLRNGSTMDFFRESKIPIYERMWSIMRSTTPTVFVNNSKEGIARVKAGNYAYLMESSMLEFYTGDDCQLQTVGGLLDSKGYGVALPKGSSLRNLFSKAILQLQERTILEALKNKWWRASSRRRKSDVLTSGTLMVDGEALCSPSDGRTGVAGGASESGSSTNGRGPIRSSLNSIFGIFYLLYAGIALAVLVAVGEFCIESRASSLRIGLTLSGRLVRWLSAMFEPKRDVNNGGGEIALAHGRRTCLESAEAAGNIYSTKDRRPLRDDISLTPARSSPVAESAAVYFERAPIVSHHTSSTQPTRQRISTRRECSVSPPTVSGRRRQSSIFIKLSTPTISFTVDPTSLLDAEEGCRVEHYDSGDQEATISTVTRQNLHRLIPQSNELLLARRISMSVMQPDAPPQFQDGSELFNAPSYG